MESGICNLERGYQCDGRRSSSCTLVYQCDAGEAYEVFKAQIIESEAQGNSGVGADWFLEHERIRYQSSSVYIYGVK
jgi:hypothetical protein